MMFEFTGGAEGESQTGYSPFACFLSGLSTVGGKTNGTMISSVRSERDREGEVRGRGGGGELKGVAVEYGSECSLVLWVLMVGLVGGFVIIIGPLEVRVV